RARLDRDQEPDGHDRAGLVGTHSRVTRPGHHSGSGAGQADSTGGLHAPASRGVVPLRANGFSPPAAATGVALSDQDRTTVAGTIAARDRPPVPAEGEANRVRAYLQDGDSGLVAAASPSAAGGASRP